jgi:hypothetical protein
LDRIGHTLAWKHRTVPARIAIFWIAFGPSNRPPPPLSNKSICIQQRPGATTTDADANASVTTASTKPNNKMDPVEAMSWKGLAAFCFGPDGAGAHEFYNSNIINHHNFSSRWYRYCCCCDYYDNGRCCIIRRIGQSRFVVLGPKLIGRLLIIERISRCTNAEDDN